MLPVTFSLPKSPQVAKVEEQLIILSVVIFKQNQFLFVWFFRDNYSFSARSQKGQKGRNKKDRKGRWVADEKNCEKFDFFETPLTKIFQHLKAASFSGQDFHCVKAKKRLLVLANHNAGFLFENGW